MIRDVEVYQGRIARVTIEIPDNATEEEFEAAGFKAAEATNNWVEVGSEKWVRLYELTKGKEIV